MRYSVTQGSADMSPFRPSFFPPADVFSLAARCFPSKFLRLTRKPFPFNRLRTLYLSCSFFSHPLSLFSIICALFDKNTGGGVCANVLSGRVRHPKKHRGGRPTTRSDGLEVAAARLVW